MASNESRSTVPQHLDQGIPVEWLQMEHDGTTYVVRDVPEGVAELYVVAGQSRNVRTLANCDAVLYEGNVVWTHYDHDLRSVEFVHDYAGTIGRQFVEEWLDEPAIQLEKIRSGSGDIMEATA